MMRVGPGIGKCSQMEDRSPPLRLLGTQIPGQLTAGSFYPAEVVETLRDAIAGLDA